MTVTLDPNEFDIADLGPKVNGIDDAAELREILRREESGKDRPPVKTLIESRIEAVADADDDGGGIDLAEMSAADVANAARSIDDPDEIRDVLDRERSGQGRDAVVSVLESRLESLRDPDDGDEIEGEDEGGETVPPEERHPDLDHPTADKQYVKALSDGVYRDAWVYCETQAGELIDVSLEMLGKARALMDEYNDEYGADERVVAVLIGDDVAGHAETCIECGADVVVYHEDDRLDRFRHKPYAEVFADMARWGAEPPVGAGTGREQGTDPDPADWRDYDEPRYVLFPATNNGRDLSAQVQAELDSGLASDCSGLYITEAAISNPVKTGSPGSERTFGRVLHMKRPDFSGFEYSTILCLDNPDREFHPQGASVIPGSFEMPDPDPERSGEVVEHDLALPDDWFRVTVEEFDRLEGGVDLTGNDVIVCLGRGIGDDPTRGMELGLELADRFDEADVGVTRGIVTGSYQFDGHVERYTAEERQIGETGQVVEPDLYVAAGVSGAVQHKVGCDEADTIVAINTDPDARIHDWCDYFVEGDLFEVLPRLIDAVETGDLDLDAGAGVATGGGDRP